MSTFADEVSRDIQRAEGFWTDLASLRAVGIRSTLASSEGATMHGPSLDEGALARLLNSASVMAHSADESSKDLAQQIAVFGALTSHDSAVKEAASHILADLGNFPGLRKLEAGREDTSSFQTVLRKSLLAAINSVEISGAEVSLTEFQLDVWQRLKTRGATAISAPTSAGKSFVVLEHLCEAALSVQQFTAIYLAPTRALLNEVHAKIERRLKGFESSIRVTTIPLLDPSERQKQIYVLTQERAQLLLSTIDVQNLFDLVVVDEAQAIGDDSRGMILQDVLERLRTANPRTRFLFLAPGAQGFEALQVAVGLESLDVAETELSPVVQNRISVRFEPGDEHRVELDLVTPHGDEKIGSYVFQRGFALSEDGKLAACALEFGSTGRSLVYATGPKNAEDLAALLALNSEEIGNDRLSELATFIQQHVHKQYSLANLVRRGVAFHYGSMPSLLRESIEDVFRAGDLNYLCCTTTLFQGVNLPARNVFIDTPTRGRGDPLDAAALWNFAGRAGRLGEEVVGNVFLVNYPKWDSQPLTVRRPFSMTVAFNQAIAEKYEEVIGVLESAAARDSASAKRFSPRATAAAGLVLLRASQGTLANLLDRKSLQLDEHQKVAIAFEAKSTLGALELPESVLASSWVISPLAMSLLLERLRSGVKKREFDRLMPVNPSGDSYAVYQAIIRRLFKYLGGLNLAGEEAKRVRGYVNHVTVTALKWMRGEPLSQLVAESVRFKLSTRKAGSRSLPQAVIDSAIRDMFELVEKTIRFQLVQWGKAYVDLLRFALNEGGHEDLARQVYDFSLALELGVSTGTGRSLMELGLTRISASAIAPLITDSAMTPEQVRRWIEQKPESLLGLSGLILRELHTRGLLAADAPN